MGHVTLVYWCAAFVVINCFFLKYWIEINQQHPSSSIVSKNWNGGAPGLRILFWWHRNLVACNDGKDRKGYIYAVNDKNMAVIRASLRGAVTKNRWHR
jgi:hypothetical protein